MLGEMQRKLKLSLSLSLPGAIPSRVVGHLGQRHSKSHNTSNSAIPMPVLQSPVSKLSPQDSGGKTSTIMFSPPIDLLWGVIRFKTLPM